jgi:hypothetical protein
MQAKVEILRSIASNTSEADKPTCDNERIARGKANTRVPSYATQHESISNPYVIVSDTIQTRSTTVDPTRSFFNHTNRTSAILEYNRRTI